MDKSNVILGIYRVPVQFIPHKLVSIYSIQRDWRSLASAPPLHCSLYCWIANQSSSLFSTQCILEDLIESDIAVSLKVSSANSSVYRSRDAWCYWDVMKETEGWQSVCQTPSSWSRAPWSKVNTIQYIWEEMSLTKRISRPVSAPDWLVCILDFLCPKFYIEAEYTWTLSSMSPFTSHQVQAPAPANIRAGEPQEQSWQG